MTDGLKIYNMRSCLMKYFIIKYNQLFCIKKYKYKLLLI